MLLMFKVFKSWVKPIKHSKNTNIFMTNRHDGDTVYNPITNKMVKRNGKIGKTSR
jgi:hypothetical protein